MFLPCSIACENRSCHSALGEALRPPPNPPSRFFCKTQRHTCKKLPYIFFYVYLYTQKINTETYTDVFACSIACENRSCHSALGEALRPPPNPPFRFSSFQDTKTHLH